MKTVKPVIVILMLDLWLAKDNRFLNPKSSYERILLAPPCRLINDSFLFSFQQEPTFFMGQLSFHYNASIYFTFFYFSLCWRNGAIDSCFFFPLLDSASYARDLFWRYSVFLPDREFLQWENAYHHEDSWSWRKMHYSLISFVLGHFPSSIIFPITRFVSSF